jgi:predicted permease
MGMVGVVLLIACVNIASLLIGRTAARRRELGVRMALGAGRATVIRQLLLENLVLAAAGGGAGLLVAWMIAGPAARLLSTPEGAAYFSTTPDARVLLFTLGVTLLTALVSGIIPAFQGRKADLAVVLKSDVTDRAPVFFRKVLVVAQVSFCVWLMMAAALFARSLARLRAVDPGFRADHALTFRMDPALSGYPDKAVLDLYSRVEQRLAALPGVSAVSLSDAALLRGGINIMRLAIEGYRPARPQDTDVVQLWISPGYLRSLGVRLSAGRDFNPTDWSHPAVALVNQAFVRKYFPGQNPLGRHIRNIFTGPNLEIVGVVRDHRFVSLRQAAEPSCYVLNSWPGGVTFYVRTGGDPEALLTATRRVVSEVAPGVPVFDLRTLRAQLDRSIGTERQFATLAGIFALLANLLAAVGLYGVMAFTVDRRSREIGIRMALGATRGKVLRMVLAETAMLVAAGLLTGVPSGIWLTRLVGSQLYGIEPNDLVAFAVAVLVVTTVSFVAGFLPARRATVIDPMLALRWE